MRYRSQVLPNWYVTNKPKIDGLPFILCPTIAGLSLSLLVWHMRAISTRHRFVIQMTAPLGIFTAEK